MMSAELKIKGNRYTCEQTVSGSGEIESVAARVYKNPSIPDPFSHASGEKGRKMGAQR